MSCCVPQGLCCFLHQHAVFNKLFFSKLKKKKVYSEKLLAVVGNGREKWHIILQMFSQSFLKASVCSNIPKNVAWKSPLVSDKNQQRFPFQ